MDAWLDERELEDASLGLVAQRRVGAVPWVGDGGVEREDEEVGRDEDEDGGRRRGRPPPGRDRDARRRDGDERGHREVGDRHEPARYPRVPQRREDIPQPLVEREVGTQREQEGGRRRPQNGRKRA